MQRHCAKREDLRINERPSTRPGHRLPHVWLDFQQGTSSHDLLDYARFTLMVAGDARPWQNALETELTLPQDELAVVDLTRFPIEDADQSQLLRLLELRPGAVLLVRPDGYVAWRYQTPGRDPAAALGAALSHIGYRAFSDEAHAEEETEVDETIPLEE